MLHKSRINKCPFRGPFDLNSNKYGVFYRDLCKQTIKTSLLLRKNEDTRVWHHHSLSMSINNNKV